MAGTNAFAKDFNILDYGAVAGGEALCSAAIQAAIDACAESGGGRVVVPAGTFLTGGVTLKSGVELHLDADAVLLGSPWMRDYPHHEPRTKVRYDKYLLTSLLFAQGANDISVTGTGTLNGNSTESERFHGRGPGREASALPDLV